MDPNMFYFQKAAEQITLQMQTAADVKGGTAAERLAAGNPYALTLEQINLVCLLTLYFKKLKMYLYLQNLQMLIIFFKTLKVN